MTPSSAGFTQQYQNLTALPIIDAVMDRPKLPSLLTDMRPAVGTGAPRWHRRH